MLTPGGPLSELTATPRGSLSPDPVLPTSALRPADASGRVCTDPMRCSDAGAPLSLPHREPQADTVGFSVAILEMAQAQSDLIFCGSLIEFSTLSGRQIRGRTRRTQLSQEHGQALRGRGRAEPGGSASRQGQALAGSGAILSLLASESSGFRLSLELGPFHLWAFILRSFRWGQAPIAGGELLPRGWEGGGRGQPAPLPPGLTVVGPASLLCQGRPAVPHGSQPSRCPSGGNTPLHTCLCCGCHFTSACVESFPAVPGAGNSELRPCPKDSQSVGRRAYLINRNRPLMGRVPEDRPSQPETAGSLQRA